MKMNRYDKMVAIGLAQLIGTIALIALFALFAWDYGPTLYAALFGQ